MLDGNSVCIFIPTVAVVAVCLFSEYEIGKLSACSVYASLVVMARVRALRVRDENYIRVQPLNFSEMVSLLQSGRRSGFLWQTLVFLALATGQLRL